jgi:hypothetical protein
MTHGDKVKYLKLALAMEGITITPKAADTIVTTFEEIMQRKGKFRLKDADKIKIEMGERYDSSEVKIEQEGTDSGIKTIKGKTKRKYTKRANTEVLAAPTFPENTLGWWLTLGSTIDTLQKLNEKYPAGLPMRLKTIIFKHGDEKLLNKSLDKVERRDLIALPRAGSQAWNVFVEARDGKVPV